MKNEKTGISPAALMALLGGDFENAIVASTPGGIEAQEKEGQTTFVNSTTLPRRMLHGCTREKLESMGIVFGDNINEKGDNLFVNVQLPEGWTKQATDHSMWSDLLDEKGRKRAAIFYKAAFYDRSSHMSLICRYSIGCYVSCDADGIESKDYNSSHEKTTIQDCGKTIHEIAIRENIREYNPLTEIHPEQARDWLNEHFPDWKDELAYWNEPEDR